MGEVHQLPPRHTRDYEAAAQRAAEEHLTRCQDALYDEEGAVPQDTPASAPFCGCDTCVVREVLFAAWPHLQELAREECAT